MKRLRVKTKWLWRYAKEEDALCKKVILSKYGKIVLVGGARGALTHMGQVVGNLSMQVWTFSSLWFILKREMRLGCCFGAISSAGNILLKFNFQIFSRWLL